MWRFEKNPEYIKKAYTTNNPVRLGRDVVIGEYDPKPHKYNFRPVCITSRGHSGSRCISWIMANLHYYFGRTYNLSGDSYHTTPEIRRRQNVEDPLHDTIIATVNKYLSNGFYRLPANTLRDEFRFEIAELRNLFEEHFLQLYDSDLHSGWCWKDTDSYMIFPIFYEVLRPYNPVIFHIIRDGKDIAFKSHRTDSAVEAPGPALMKILGYDKNTPQHIRSAASWSFQLEQFLRWGKIGDMIEIRYEEMARDPRGCIQNICRIIGAPNDLYDASEIAKPIYSDRISQYKGEAPEQIAEVEELICDVLKRYDYL